MRCPFCGFEDTKVIDSRPSDGKKRRRRECIKCGKRFTTYEIVEKPLLMVQKKDGSFEQFDKNKLITGIYSAIKKRPISMADVSGIAEGIETYYANEMRNQITSAEIGDMVLEKLRTIDPVSYIRFASVYKDFTDVDSFIKAISELDRK
ncbi:MAG TPA: transcriptional regulator NrdR [Ruminococcus sp.]|nr:transcriptional regulator NrdR [Ruminococcus sp.]HBN10726.1 transcriptional regulator NrdR [Ruminococcus sp.]HCR73351.1 transcriptional regulator NrdR [Ruminococcus sp.]